MVFCLVVAVFERVGASSAMKRVDRKHAWFENSPSGLAKCRFCRELIDLDETRCVYQCVMFCHEARRGALHMN